MPAESLTHPDKLRLIAFGLGKLELDDAIEIETHLNVCHDCCDTLLNLKDDTFIGLLRESAEAMPDAGSVTAPIAQSSKSAIAPDDIPAELREHPRYRVSELIGKGGMGLVFKAEHKLMNRWVALKVINPKLLRDPEAIKRFHREVQAAARLAHPNIVTAYDAEHAGDVHFLVMEYVDGENLAEVIVQRGPLEIATAAEFIRQAADGLQHAHARSMVHRDIKPHNLMVDANGHVKILDFGLATFALSAGDEPTASSEGGQKTFSAATALGTVMGTPDYISPEQVVDCCSVDIRSDIYSLGCTFYHLLTGRPPFHAGSAMKRAKSHAFAEPVPIEEVRTDIPPHLAAVVRRMMAKNSTERYQSPAEVAAALAPVASPQPRAFEARRIPRPLPLVATALAASFVCAAAIFFTQLQKTTVRFEVGDPNLSISFGSDSIAVKDADRSFTISPGAEQRFIVRQNGKELETNTFTLNKGQQVALKVDVVDGHVRVVPTDESVAIGKSDNALQSIDAWVERLTSLRDHMQTAFAIGPELLLLDPEQGLEIVRTAWPKITVSEVKTGLLKAFAFSKPLHPKKHPKVLQVLDLGMRDADPEIQAYAAAYLKEFSKEDFGGNDKAYASWYSAYGAKSPEEVLRVSQSRMTESLVKQLEDFEAAMNKGDLQAARKLAGQLGEVASPVAIPLLIGAIDADNSYDTVYGIGYFGLSKITGVPYSPYHDGPWWRRWWEKHKSQYSDQVQQRKIPEFPKTASGKSHQPFPEDIDTLAGKLAYFSQLQYNGPVTLWDWASQVAAHKDPAAIPFMIGVIDADNTYDTVYGVGYFGLTKLTGVPYAESHNGAWWRKWWQENKSKYPKEVQELKIPDVRAQFVALKKNAKVAANDPQNDIADIPSKDLRAGGDKNKRYFLIGPRDGVNAPESGFKLLIVMPGGDGSAEFNLLSRKPIRCLRIEML